MLPHILKITPRFTGTAKPIARTYFYDATKGSASKDKITFACEFIFEFLSIITDDEIQELYKKLGVDLPAAAAVAISKAIDSLQIEYITPGTTVAADAPLLKVTGNKIAVEFVDTLISSVVGMMSAVATNCRELVEVSKQTFDFNNRDLFPTAKLKLIVESLPVNIPSQENLKLLQIALETTSTADVIISNIKEKCKFPPAIFKLKLRDLLVSYAQAHPDILEEDRFRSLLTHACDDRAHSYFGLRRGGPCNIPLIELAAVRGGFGSVANISSRLPFKYAAFPETIPVVGTMAHAFIMIQTAMFKQAVDDGKLSSLLKALEIEKSQYIKARTETDICDYISFRAYIKAVQEFEKEVAADGKPAPRPIILLVDTTDTLKGVRAAIQACIDTNRPLTGVRLDTTPEIFLVDAAKLLDAAAKERPDLFAHTRLFCTDGIDRDGAARIETICKDNNILRPISYGIGSSIANTEPFKLKRTDIPISEYVPDHTLPKKFSVSSARKALSKTLKAALTGNSYENPHLPADAYAPNQALLLQQLQKIYGTETDLKTVRKVTASLHFRPRDDSQNYLVVAGTDILIRFLKGFTHDTEFLDTLKQSGFVLTKQQIDDLYTLKGKVRALELDIAAAADGTELLPGQPIVTVTGRPEDVLLVESFCTSVIGGMSAAATAAAQLLEPTKKMDQTKRPKFYYAGLDQQRVPSSFTAYAAMIGGLDGSTGFTTIDDCVSLHRTKEDCIEFAGDVSAVIQAMLAAGKPVQIRGNFTAAQVEEICSKAQTKGIETSEIEFLVIGPLAAATNPKGLVYKITGVELADIKQQDAYQHVLKAAGAAQVPGKKTSIPGIEPETLVIKKGDEVVAMLIVDLRLVRETMPEFAMNDPNQILRHVLQQKPHLHFERSTASKGKADLVTIDNIDSLSAEFLLRHADPKDSLSCKTPKTPKPKESLDAAIKRQKKCAREQYHDAPVLIDAALYAKSCELLRSSINDDYYLNDKTKLRNTG